MDFSTNYLGLDLKNPIVASAGPLSKNLDDIRSLEDAGVAAIVMHSLFEEEVARGDDSASTEAYLEHFGRARDAVDIPLIGSLNGITASGWVDIAAAIEGVEADAVELNIYHLPADSDIPGHAIEQMGVEIVREVRNRVSLPVAVKLSPYYTSIPHYARSLATAGADGLVLFNRFYQPEIDLESMEATSHLELSTSADIRLPLRWIAVLAGRIPVDFALSSGVHTYADVIKGLLAGASVTMMTSALLRKGVDHVTETLERSRDWLDQHNFVTVGDVCGHLSQKEIANPDAFERANYVNTIRSCSV